MLRSDNPSLTKASPVNLLNAPYSPIYLLDRQTFEANLAATLTKTLRTMLTHTSSERGRTAVPLITEAQSISPFPIKMVVKVGGAEVG